MIKPCFPLFRKSAADASSPLRRLSGTLASAAILILCLLASALGARADDDRHWTTTNHVHKGIITRAASSGSATALDDSSVTGGHNYLGKFTLSYALWSLEGQPVEDYIFVWDWQPGDLVVGRGPAGNITTADLAKYPDLPKQFYSIRPISVTLATEIEFYDAQDFRFGLGTKTVKPDLIAPAGPNEPLHVPGSPTWQDFFRCDYQNPALTVNGAKPAATDFASRNKERFQQAVRVQLVRPKITAVEWPEGELRMIADEFNRREGVEKQRQADALARAQARSNQVAQAGAATNTSTAPKLATGPNPFEQAAGQSGGPNPFEQAASRNASSGPANPFELARSGVRTGPENPFEANARQEAEERAQQEQLAEIERQKEEREEARQEAIAQREEEARQRKFAAELAASQHNYEDDAADRAYRRAYNQQNQERAARAAQSQNNNFFLDLQQQIGRMYGNNSASSVYGNPNTATGSSSGGAGSGLSLHVGKASQPTKIGPGPCPWCGGTGKCSNCKGTGEVPTTTMEVPAEKSSVIYPGMPMKTITSSPVCPQCNGSGECPHCHGTGLDPSQ